MTLQDKNEQYENRVYEFGFHLISSIPEERIAAEVTALKDVLDGAQAKFISEDFPKLKNLSYTMVKVLGPKRLKFNNAYFGWIKFEMEPSAIEAVKRTFTKNDNLLRFLIVKTVRESTLASAKAPSYRISDVKKPIPGIGDGMKPVQLKSPISEAELDKTIEALVVE